MRTSPHSLSVRSVQEFWLELEKVAGVREALKVLVTGRVPLYHGTSKQNARSILREGLLANKERGVTSVLPTTAAAEKGVTFLTRHKAIADTYARQASALSRVEKLKKLIPKKDRERVRQWVRVEAPAEQQELAQAAVTLFPTRALVGSRLSGKGRVVRADVPRRVLRGIQTSGRELHVNPAAVQQREKLRQVHPAAEQAVALNFITDVPVRGGVAPTFIRGSKGYQHVSPQELKDHVKDIRQNPGEFGKDVLRSLLGVSHRPSTLLRQG